LILNMEK